LAGTLRHAGKLDEAIAAGQTAVESSGRNPWTVVEQSSGRNPWTVVELGLSYAAAGRKDDARELHRETLARSQPD
jgi:hypothetical protein